MKYIITESQYLKLLESEKDFGDEIVGKKIFDRVFDHLDAENNGEGYVRWLLPNVPEGLDDEALEAYIAKTFLGINEERFYELLVNYLNDKFSDVVGDRPVRDVGSHYCDEN